jgi:hypothetical protein
MIDLQLYGSHTLALFSLITASDCGFRLHTFSLCGPGQVENEQAPPLADDHSRACLVLLTQYFSRTAPYSSDGTGMTLQYVDAEIKHPLHVDALIGLLRAIAQSPAAVARVEIDPLPFEAAISLLAPSTLVCLRAVTVRNSSQQSLPPALDLTALRATTLTNVRLTFAYDGPPSAEYTALLGVVFELRNLRVLRLDRTLAFESCAALCQVLRTAHCRIEDLDLSWSSIASVQQNTQHPIAMLFEAAACNRSLTNLDAWEAENPPAEAVWVSFIVCLRSNSTLRSLTTPLIPPHLWPDVYSALAANRSLTNLHWMHRIDC